MEQNVPYNKNKKECHTEEERICGTQIKTKGEKLWKQQKWKQQKSCWKRM